MKKRLNYLLKIYREHTFKVLRMISTQELILKAQRYIKYNSSRPLPDSLADLMLYVLENKSDEQQLRFDLASCIALEIALNMNTVLPTWCLKIACFFYGVNENCPGYKEWLIANQSVLNSYEEFIYNLKFE